MYFDALCSPVIRGFRGPLFAVVVVLLCTITLAAQSKRSIASVGHATLQIHLFVVPIVSSHPAQVITQRDVDISYGFPLPRAQNEVTVQESTMPPTSKAAFGSKAACATLMTSTTVQP